MGACTTCWAALASGPSVRCRRCALPLADGAWDLGHSQGCCVRCAIRPFPFDRAIAAVSYDGLARRFLLRAKDGRRPELLLPLAGQLAAAVAVSGLADGVDGVVPVPSSPAARWRRGFDPARELARELARSAALRLLDRALRKRGLARPASKALGAPARWAGAVGSVAVRRKLPGATILLVDDVLTTGATATACAAALRAAGAIEVRVAVWARTPSPGSSFDRPPARGL